MGNKNCDFMKEIKTTVMILGAGAGGFGAAYALTQAHIPVVAADINSGFGGTAVFSGVSCFEPGVSLDGVHSRLAEILLENGGGEVQKTVPSHLLFEDSQPFPYPWGLSVKADDSYKSTLMRCKKFRSGYPECSRFMTDENALSAAMQSLIDENTAYFTPLFGYRYSGCETSGRQIKAVTVENGKEAVKIYADFFLDCTGSIVLARDAGCEYTAGDEKGSLSGINGVSFVFRVSKRAEASALPKETLPEDTEWTRERMKKCVSCFNMYPNGDINVNMLPTMTGEEWFTLGENAVQTGHSRVWSYWQYMQRQFGLEDYKIIKIFSPGIREDYRLIGRKILTYEDITAPFDENADYIAIADHAMDTHGVPDAVSGELEHPYGIPLDCTRPKEFDNMFVVCRGASFSHTAASSARLTRTMMSMGEGVAKHVIKQIDL